MTIFTAPVTELKHALPCTCTVIFWRKQGPFYSQTISILCTTNKNCNWNWFSQIALELSLSNKKLPIQKQFLMTAFVSYSHVGLLFFAIFFSKNWTDFDLPLLCIFSKGMCFLKSHFISLQSWSWHRTCLWGWWFLNVCAFWGIPIPSRQNQLEFCSCRSAPYPISRHDCPHR